MIYASSCTCYWHLVVPHCRVGDNTKRIHTFLHYGGCACTYSMVIRYIQYCVFIQFNVRHCIILS